MKKFGLLASATMTVLMVLTLFPLIGTVNAQPRADLDVIWYLDDSAAFTALTNGDVDFIQWSLTKTQMDAVELDDDLQVSSYTEYGMMEFDLNNNETILDYPTSTNPCYFADFRRALAFVVDKDYIISDILEYFGSRIDAPVAYPHTEGWCDPTVVTYDWNHNGVIDPGEDNYLYKYNIENAAGLLAMLGFSDTDANGYLNYPTGAEWGDASGIDTTAMPLKLCIRTEGEHRMACGRYLYAQLEGDAGVAGDGPLALAANWTNYGAVGGDLDTSDETWVAPRATLSPIVMGDRNYHVYTGGWSLGRFPTSLFFLYHSMFWYPYGPNYVNPYTWYDDAAAGIYYSANVAASQASAINYTGWHVRDCVTIGLWSYTSYVGWSKDLVGVVNMKGYGIENDYTFLNAYRASNPAAPIRMGCISGWDRLNILYSQWYFEFAFLDRVYTGLINANPYDTAIDIPWVAQDWEEGTWVDGRDGNTKTVITYYLRPDVGGVEPITGCANDTFDTGDYDFTVWYNYVYDDSWMWSGFMDVHHTEIVDDTTVKVYFDDASMWFAYAPTYPLLGPKEILIDKLCEEACVTFTGDNLTEINPGYFEYQMTSDSIVKVINATVNGVPMTEGVEYYIRAGYDTYCHNVFVNLTSFAPTDVITICYYRGIAGGADGIHLGGNIGLSWEDTMYSYGLYYPVGISDTSGALNRNPMFFLDTPLLGEIDWRWNWVAGPKPREGYFKIDILDVVKCTGAYCSRGDGVYDPIYLAGADIDGSDLCHIGILDLVTITGKYAQTFGRVPHSFHWYYVPLTAVPGWSTIFPGYTGGFTEKYTHNCEYTFASGTGTFTITGGSAGGWFRGYYNAGSDLEKVVITIDP